MHNNKGFTLVELAVVLVIIGIILGAVIKGQDLIENAKSKQFASKIKSWEIALNTYYDRKGRFPGDADKNGVIGDSDPQAEITDAKFVSAPENSFDLGGTIFYVFVGNSGATGVPANTNFLVVCKKVTNPCDTAFAPTTNSNDLAAMKFFESFDTAIDGTADAKAKSVQGATAVTITAKNAADAITTGNAGSTDWLATTNVKALAYQLK